MWYIARPPVPSFEPFTFTIPTALQDAYISHESPLPYAWKGSQNDIGLVGKREGVEEAGAKRQLEDGPGPAPKKAKSKRGGTGQ